MKSNIETLLISFHIVKKLELLNKILERNAFKTRDKNEERMLIVIDKTIPEEQLAQLLQTKNKHFKLPVTFVTEYNGIYNIIEQNKKHYFAKLLTKTVLSK